MPRKLRITLWVAIGLLIAVLAEVGSMTLVGIALAKFLMIMFGSIFACGIPIVYWTQKNITQVALKRYLLLAGASAMGIFFFQRVVHPFSEAGFVMALFVCPIALVVGAILALRFKANLQATE
jgi:hypothetical protein